MIHEQVLPPSSADVLQRMAASGDPSFKGWILAGGTGLALQLGHRLSEDFDFFRTDIFSPAHMHESLRQLGPYETALEDGNSLVVMLDGVKWSFFKVRDPFLYPSEPWRFSRLAAPRDIALMKLAAIGGRGARKDFIDLWFILREGAISLRACLDELSAKYGPDRTNLLHTVKSLTWFEDAERDPMPRMLVPFDWSRCRAFFEASVRELSSV